MVQSFALNHTDSYTLNMHIYLYSVLAAINPQLTKTKPHDSMFVSREHTYALCGGEVFTDQFGPIRQSLMRVHTHEHAEPVLPVSLGETLQGC